MSAENDLARRTAALAWLRTAVLHDADGVVLETEPGFTLRAELDFEAAVESIAEEIADLTARVDAAKVRVIQINRRRLRLTQRVEYLRKALLVACEQAGVQRLRLSSVTVTVKQIAPSVVVSDSAALPADYLRQPPPEPDLMKIRRALLEGLSIPGATLYNDGSTVQITTS